MDKALVLRAFEAHVIEQLALANRVADAAHGAASHPESKPENKYDTRGLEASYLAGAQSKRAAELKETLDSLRALELIPLDDRFPIEVTALVTVEKGGEPSHLFLLPFLGGQKVNVDGTLVTAVSPDAPIGKALLGSSVGDEFVVGPNTYEILDVS